MGEGATLEHIFDRIRQGTLPILRRGFDSTTYCAEDKTITLYPALNADELTRYVTLRNTANTALTQPFTAHNRVFFGRVLPVIRLGIMETANDALPYTVARDTGFPDLGTYLAGRDVPSQEMMNVALKTIETTLEKSGILTSPKFFWYNVGIHHDAVGTTLIAHELADDIGAFMRRNKAVEPVIPIRQCSPVARPTYSHGALSAIA